jgi:uncharacterized protein YoxC
MLTEYVKKNQLKDESNAQNDKINPKLEEFEKMKTVISDLNEKISTEITSAVRKLTKHE